MTLIDTQGRPLVRSSAPYSDSFMFNGQTYPVTLNQTLTGQKEEIDGSFASFAHSAFLSNPVVFSCMNVRLSLFSQVRFMFQQLRKGIPGDLFSTPALEALNEDPSPGETTGDLLSRAIQNADLSGNAFIVKRHGEFINLQPDLVSILIGSPNDPKVGARDIDARKLGYIYHPEGRNSPAFDVLLPEEVCHFAPIKHPFSKYLGVSWLTPLIREIQSDIAASDFKTLYYTNGATPNLVVSFDASIKREAFDAWVKAFEDKHVGIANAYKTLYLGAGTTVQAIGANLRENDFKAVQGASETRIVAAAGLHPTIVGLSEGLSGSSLNEGNFTAAARLTADKTFRYLWSQFAGSMQTIIKPPSGSRLWYDASQVDFLKDDEKDRANVLQVNATTITALIREGYKPDAAVDAVMAGDLRRLGGTHTGALSVQLHTPGEEPPDVKVITPEPPKQIFATTGKSRAEVVQASEVRCSGCSKLLAEFASAPYRMTCPRCKVVTSAGLGPDARTFEVVDDRAPMAERFVTAMAGMATAVASMADRPPAEVNVVVAEKYVQSTPMRDVIDKDADGNILGSHQEVIVDDV